MVRSPKSEIPNSIGFRQNFLDEAISKLEFLQKEIADNFDENLRREAFRAIHTMKGGAQAIGLQNFAEIAHALESLLSRGGAPTDQNLLLEGIERLIVSLQQNNSDSDESFVVKLDSAHRTNIESDVLITGIPSPVFRQFSRSEREAIIDAVRAGKTIFCAEVGFAASNFADDYRKLRKFLSEKSEIIASLPSEKHQSAERIGFRIFLAGRETAELLQISTADFKAEIFPLAGPAHVSGALYEMLAQVAAHAEQIAGKSGKKVCVTILTNAAALSLERTKAFFDILLHLVRNGVDHAIEHRGAIEILFFDEPDGLYLSVADDGRGIDLRKVRARATAKNLISERDSLNEEETLNLIFASEFSTAETLTETSGRGVGLDAVKTEVEKMNGKISVRNRKTNGAIFEIFVPPEKI